MGWFRKRKIGALERAGVDSQLNAQAQKLADRILALQSRWAAQLSAQAQRFGKRKTTIFLLALGIGFGCYCLWLVVAGFI